MAPQTIAMATRSPPTRGQWLNLKPEIAYWYLSKHRTAGWITKELRSRGLVVTPKMLRDRFREWKFPLKYNRSRTDERGGRNETSIDLAVTKAIATSPDDVHLTTTLSLIGHFLEDLCDSGSWLSIDSSQGLEMQKLVAGAHQTIATFNSDCPAQYDELLRLGHQVGSALARCKNPNQMHPRVLTVLLRLLVDNCTNGMESDVLATVKAMFQNLADNSLPKQHPVRLLCHTNKTQAPVLLKRLLLLTETQFYDKVSDVDPIFAVQEQIYSARVLASVGRMDDAIEMLETLLRKFEASIDVFTLADAHRTLGYAKSFKGAYDEAYLYAHAAISGFESAGKEYSDNAMYAHMCLASIHQKPGQIYDLVAAEHHASMALRNWEANSQSNGGMGGIKIVNDLHNIMLERGKTDDTRILREKYSTYFGDD